MRYKILIVNSFSNSMRAYGPELREASHDMTAQCGCLTRAARDLSPQKQGEAKTSAKPQSRYTAPASLTFSTVIERRPPDGVSNSIDWVTDSPISAAPSGVRTETLPCAMSALSG